MSIEMSVQKQLGAFRLDVSLQMDDGALALFGASGSGKSVTLSCIAGVVRPDRGRIVVDGVTLFDSEKRINLSPQARRTGLLFQNYALFPNMTVEQNLRTGIWREGDRKEAEKRLARTVESFGLQPLLAHKPHQLSGGQKQRAALARILISRPRILMLDEPFSALDTHLRRHLEDEVRQIMRAFGGTVLFVSHEMGEVYRLCDRIALLDNGRVLRAGDKARIFASPGTRTAAALTGCRNISRAERTGAGRVFANDWGIFLHVPEETANAPFLGVRARAICMGAGENALRCRVLSETENPFTTDVSLLPIEAADGACPLIFECDRAAWAAARRSEVTISIPPDAIFALAE